MLVQLCSVATDYLGLDVEESMVSWDTVKDKEPCGYFSPKLNPSVEDKPLLSNLRVCGNCIFYFIKGGGVK